MTNACRDIAKTANRAELVEFCSSGRNFRNCKSGSSLTDDQLSKSCTHTQSLKAQAITWASLPHLDKGEPQNVVGDAVEPQGLQVLPVAAVAGDQELSNDEGCKGNSCPPGDNNGKHSCPYSYLQ